MPSLLATLGLDATKFHAAFRQAQGATKEFGSSVTSSLGGVASAALAGFGFASLINSAVETASRIHNLSQEFRVSTDTIQIWEKGAKEVGLTAEDIGNAFNKLKKARADAIGKGEVGAFGQFGIGMEELKDSAISVEEIMGKMQLSAGSHPITDAEDVAGMELMGKSGAKILGAMEQIAKAGPISVISEEDIKAMHEAEEILGRVKKEMVIDTAKVLGPAAKATQGVFDGIAMGWEQVKALFRGEGKFNSQGEFGVLEEVGPEAPAFDLKGRSLIGRPTHAASAEGSTGKDEKGFYSNKKFTVDLNKDAKEIDKERERLSSKIADNQLRAMTAIQRQTELKKQIAEHERKAIEFEFEGEELKSLKEKNIAADLRGKLLTDRKANRMDFTAGEKIGAFANVSALSNSNPAQKTAEHTALTAEYVKQLLQTTVKISSYVSKAHGAWNAADKTTDLANSMTRF